MCRPGIRQVLRHWEHLLNTPSASITDELHPPIGARIVSQRVKSEPKGSKTTLQRICHLDCRACQVDCRATAHGSCAASAGTPPVRQDYSGAAAGSGVEKHLLRPGKPDRSGATV